MAKRVKQSKQEVPVKKTRKANGEGTVYKRPDGRRAAQISLGNGKRKTIYGINEDDARAKKTLAQADIIRGVSTPTGRLKVGEYLDSWLLKRAPRLKYSSQRRYRDMIEYIKHGIGGIQLTRLTEDHVAQLYKQAFETGLPGESRLPSTTVHLMHAVLHSALKRAVISGLVSRNVADNVDPYPAVKYEPKILTDEQLRLVVEVSADYRLHALFVLEAYAGMRLSELTGLHWKDVLLEEGIVRVKTATEEGERNHPKMGTPKTDNSIRTIYLGPDEIAALCEHKTRQKAERLAAGPCWHENDLIWCSRPTWAR